MDRELDIAERNVAGNRKKIGHGQIGRIGLIGLTGRTGLIGLIGL